MKESTLFEFVGLKGLSSLELTVNPSKTNMLVKGYDDHGNRLIKHLNRARRPYPILQDVGTAGQAYDLIKQNPNHTVLFKSFLLDHTYLTLNEFILLASPLGSYYSGVDWLKNSDGSESYTVFFIAT